MGWSLELFLKQFVFLDWITKEQAVYIKDNMNAPTCSLFARFDHKFTCDDNRIQDLEAQLERAEAEIILRGENFNKVKAHLEKADGVIRFYAKISTTKDTEEGLMVRDGFNGAFYTITGKARKYFESKEELK